MMSSLSKSALSVPWVSQPGGDYSRFYCVANKEAYTFSTSCYDGEIVGSSHGWISFYDKSNHHLSLSDPITERVIELPPPTPSCTAWSSEKTAVSPSSLSAAAAGWLSSRGAARIEWIPLLNPSAAEKKRVYEGVVHSSRHNRLFCITSAAEDEDIDDGRNSKLELECWDLGEGEESDQLESPKLQQVVELDLDSPLQKETTAKKKLKYLVCAEHTGEMYVVVRHVSDNTDRDFSTYNRVDLVAYYVTLGMDVYKIEMEVGKAVRMEHLLEGVAMFVGNNQGMALPAAEHSGLNPNCVYFTHVTNVYGERDRVGGIFDYQKREISPLTTYSDSFDNYAYNHDFWFTPRPHFF